MQYETAGINKAIEHQKVSQMFIKTKQAGTSVGQSRSTPEKIFQFVSPARKGITLWGLLNKISTDFN